MTTAAPPIPTDRAALLGRLAEGGRFDVAVVGGGATGLGVALDAAARGLRVLLLDGQDFAKGTSSRSTKLLHGGVRYLAQGNVALVKEALHERTTVLRNAPHLAQPLPFVMPSYKAWEAPFYGVGLKVYDALAGSAGLGATDFLGREATLRALPTLRTEGLKGGVRYWDGQFDDARLALALARTAASLGALLVNHCPVTGLVHEGGKLVGLRCHDAETGQRFEVQTRCVINATGVWVDGLRQQDGAARQAQVRPMVAPSQGVHVVVDRDFLPSDHALLVPKTADGRVLFAVPWLGKLILGTTDTPRSDLPLEPDAFAHEIDFILGESARYLQRAPTAADVKSHWVGLRPLVRPDSGSGENTQGISREHTVLISASGLVTVTGGKWTTYRAMAEDVLKKCRGAGLLPHLEDLRAGRTDHLPLVGAAGTPSDQPPISAPPGAHSYGGERDHMWALPGAERELGGGLTEAMVRFAVRFEYARTVEDVLARRSRLLFLDAALAASLAEDVGAIVLQETGRDPQVAACVALARQHLNLPGR